MMSDINTLNKVIEIVADTLKQFRGISITPTSDLSLIDSGTLDSLSIVTLVQRLQDEFNVEIQASDLTLENFDTVRLISKMIESRLS